MSLLIAPAGGPLAAACADRVTAGGLTVVGHAECHSLVREVVRAAPEAVLLAVSAMDDGWCQALALLADAHPVPVLWWGAERLPDDLDGLAERGVHGALPFLPPAEAVGELLRCATACHRRHRRLSEAALLARQALEDRKWLDRAKGVLMGHQQITEDTAFQLLRTASMHANLRLGELSRGVVQVAQAAEAVNRAGQLRMLSQRLVKAMAQWRAGVEAHAAREVAQSVLAMVEDNLAVVSAVEAGHALEAADGLNAAAVSRTAPASPSGREAGGSPKRVPAATDTARALDAVRRHWRALKAACQGQEPPAAAELVAMDAQAERLLQASDALVLALEGSARRPQLALVNRCGRQRMLAQRLGKQALLAGLLDEAAATDQANGAAATVDDFEQSLVLLEQAPLTTSAIRSELAQARREWQRLLDSVRRASTGNEAQAHAAQRQIAHEADALLARFDRLTSLYEHSMQLLLG